MSKKTEIMAFNDVKNQTDAVVWHLQFYGKITSWEAIKEYGITRLSSIIFNLRKRGYKITSVDKVFKNRFGHDTIVAEYIYSAPVEIRLDKDNQVTMF